MRTLPVSVSQVGLIHIIALLGILYSGMLAYRGATTEECMIGGACWTLFRIPVCYYGLFGFSVSLLLATTVFWCSLRTARKVYGFLFWFVLLGSLFALYYLIRGLFVSPISFNVNIFSSGYPSCFYGLILFSGIFFGVRNSIAHWEMETEKKYWRNNL